MFSSGYRDSHKYICVYMNNFFGVYYIIFLYVYNNFDIELKQLTLILGNYYLIITS